MVAFKGELASQLNPLLITNSKFAVLTDHQQQMNLLQVPTSLSCPIPADQQFRLRKRCGSVIGFPPPPTPGQRGIGLGIGMGSLIGGGGAGGVLRFKRVYRYS